MKKLTAMLLAGVMAASLLVGCGSTETTTTETTETTEATETEETETEETEVEETENEEENNATVNKKNKFMISEDLYLMIFHYHLIQFQMRN